MLLRRIVTAGLTLASVSLSGLSLAASNPFLPAPAVASAGTPADKGGPLANLPPAPPDGSALPPPPSPAAIKSSSENLPIGKINGELIYLDGTRYKFKDDKPKLPVKRKKTSASHKESMTQKINSTGSVKKERQTKHLVGDEQLVGKALPLPAQTAARGPVKPSSIPSLRGKPVVSARTIQSAVPAGKPGALPIKAISEKK